MTSREPRTPSVVPPPSPRISDRRRTQWFFGITALVLLFLATFIILKPFWVPVAWAIVLAVVTWPLYHRILEALGYREALAALIMTTLLVLAIVGPVVFLSVVLVDEARQVYQVVQTWTQQGPPELPAWIRDLPWIGQTLEAYRQNLLENPEAWRQTLQAYQKQWLADMLSTGRRIGVNLIKALLTIFTLYFIFRYGESLFIQTRRVFSRLMGQETSRYLQPVGDTIRAVVYGIVLTALVQGILAGIGYWVAGVPSPVLLGAATTLLALFPFGAPLVWIPSGLYLISQGHLWHGVGLLLWGGLVISWIDNLLRPMFISGSTRIPFLLVFFGLAGGVMAFGMIGLLVGPVILSVMLTLWREWAEGAGERRTRS